MPRGSFAPRKIAAAIERNDTGFGSRIADRTVNKLDIPSGYPPNTERHKLVVNGTEDREFTTNFTNQIEVEKLTSGSNQVVITGRWFEVPEIFSETTPDPEISETYG